jgi:hypothetical protein
MTKRFNENTLKKQYTSFEWVTENDATRFQKVLIIFSKG